MVGTCVHSDHSRPDPRIVATLARSSSATVHEAIGQLGALDAAIRPIMPSMRLAGPALTVHCPAGDNLMIHAAIAAAEPGDVLVVDHEASVTDGPFGDVLAQACRARGIAGLVIDGCVRDYADLERIGFPVFARGLCIRGTTKSRKGSVGRAITIADVTIEPGDIVLGDADGVVVVPAAMLEQAVEAAAAREFKEEQMRQALRSGELTLDLLGLRAALSAD